MSLLDNVFVLTVFFWPAKTERLLSGIFVSTVITQITSIETAGV